MKNDELYYGYGFIWEDVMFDMFPQARNEEKIADELEDICID